MIAFGHRRHHHLAGGSLLLRSFLLPLEGSQEEESRMMSPLFPSGTAACGMVSPCSRDTREACTARPPLPAAAREACTGSCQRESAHSSSARAASAASAAAAPSVSGRSQQQAASPAAPVALSKAGSFFARLAAPAHFPLRCTRLSAFSTSPGVSFHSTLLFVFPAAAAARRKAPAPTSNDVPGSAVELKAAFRLFQKKSFGFAPQPPGEGSQANH